MFYRCLTVSFITLVASTLAPAQAQRIPPGSYQQSCTNIRVRAGVVTAECSTTGGSRITSSTSVNCNGDIGNVNGYLRCNGGGHWSGGLPAGSYQQSCTNARMNGSRLAASCSATNGRRIASTLDVNTCRRGADIGNRNGYLGCDRR